MNEVKERKGQLMSRWFSCIFTAAIKNYICTGWLLWAPVGNSGFGEKREGNGGTQK